MTEYRLYRLNDRNRITSRADYEAADDRVALRVASEECGGSSWELWEHSRRVAASGPATPRPR